MHQLILFIIFIISHMVQSAPLSHDQRIRRQANDITTINIITLKISFYCAAKSFQDNAGILNGRSIGLESNDTSNRTKISDRTTVLHPLFAKISPLKHQLQDYLFSQDSSSLTTEETT